MDARKIYKMLRGIRRRLSIRTDSRDKQNRIHNENILDHAGRYGKVKTKENYTDGGPGSGNHGHAGIPGKQGGSMPKSSSTGANAPCTGFKNKAAAKRHRKHWEEFGFKNHADYEKAAISFIQQPTGGDVDGYIRKDGAVVRFNKKTGEIGIGIPGSHVVTYYKARYDKKKGRPNIRAANNYFARLKATEAL